MPTEGRMVAAGIGGLVFGAGARRHSVPLMIVGSCIIIAAFLGA